MWDKYLAWLVVVFCLIVGGTALAENDSLRVCLNGGSSVAFSLEDIQKITFDLTGVTEEGLAKLASSFKALVLMQNRPNPFRVCSLIAYDLPKDGKTKLAIYNINGQLVRELVSAEMKAGRHQAIWDGRNSQGGKVANGTYIYKLESGGQTLARKSIIIR